MKEVTQFHISIQVHVVICYIKMRDPSKMLNKLYIHTYRYISWYVCVWMDEAVSVGRKCFISRHTLHI